jgi:putative nucleotidyltransferase with HDIG domain
MTFVGGICGFMTPETRIKRINHFIGRMPSLSTTVSKVLEVCNNPNASANDLNRVISYDPVLTGQMLKLINSAYYGLPNRITSLTRAIIMLGINTVKNLVLTTSILAGCKGLSSSRHMTINDFWAHCLCVGVLCKLIAARSGISAIEQEEYFVAGLLHDLGKLPMMACFPDLYSRTVQAAKDKNIQLFESETMHIGFNHCQVGMLIAAKWRLGEALREVINEHHRQAGQSETAIMVSSTALSNHLANHFKVGTAGDQFANPLSLRTQLDLMGLSIEALTDLKAQMEIEIEKAKVFLQMAEKGSIS